MKNKKNVNDSSSSNSILNDGIIQFLTVLKFNTTNIDKCIKSLQKSNLVITETVDKNMKIKDGYLESLNQLFLSSVQQTANEFLYKNAIDYLKINIRSGDETKNIIDSTSNDTIHISIQNPLIDEVESFIDKHVNDLNANIHLEIQYKRTEFLIQPFIINNDDSIHPLFITLSIFETGLAILKIEYEIKDTAILDLSKKALSTQFNISESPDFYNNGNWGYSLLEEVMDDEELKEKIIKQLAKITQTYITVGTDYKILLLSDYTSKPDTIENAGQMFIKDIVYLIASPIRSFNEPSKNKFDEFYKKSHFEINKFSHVFVSSARKIIIAKIGDIDSRLMQETGYDPSFIKELSNRVHLQGVTPAVETVLLKYFDNCEIADKCSNVAGKSLKELLEIKLEIHNLILFETKAYKSKFDTMTQLVEFIDISNTYLLSNKQIEKIVGSFNDVITTKQSINSEKTSALFSWLGVILSLIFSITIVRDLIEFINDTFEFIAVDDSYSLFILSFKSWIGIVIIVVLLYWFTRKSKR